jgi:hypothetical protein
VDKIDQETMEALYSKRNIHTVLHEAIKHELDKFLLTWALLAYVRIPEWLEGKYFKSKDIRLATLKKDLAVNGLETLVVAIAASVLHTHTVQTIQQCTGYLQAFLPHENAFDRAKTAAELIALCSRDTGLYAIERHGSGDPATIKVHHWPLVEKKLLSAFKWINDTCFNPPLVEPPKKVSNNIQCGYHTINEPLILGSLTMHNLPQNYKAVNMLNQIEWVLDQDVLAEPEVPGKPCQNSEQHQRFNAMVQSSKYIYGLLADDPFYFAWQYDSRGRMYSHGYHVNLQAAEYKKASLSFNKYEVLT